MIGSRAGSVVSPSGSAVSSVEAGSSSLCSSSSCGAAGSSTLSSAAAFAAAFTVPFSSNSSSAKTETGSRVKSMIAAMTSASSFDPLALFIGLFLSVNYFAFCRFRLLPHMQSHLGTACAVCASLPGGKASDQLNCWPSCRQCRSRAFRP